MTKYLLVFLGAIFVSALGWGIYFVSFPACYEGRAGLCRASASAYLGINASREDVQFQRADLGNLYILTTSAGRERLRRDVRAGDPFATRYASVAVNNVCDAELASLSEEAAKVGDRNATTLHIFKLINAGRQHEAEMWLGQLRAESYRRQIGASLYQEHFAEIARYVIDARSKPRNECVPT